MQTTTTYGEYGQKLIGGASTQVVTIHHRAFLVTYTFESWSDVLGGLEVLDMQELVDEFGMGSISLSGVEDGWVRMEVEKAFKAQMQEAVKAATRTL